MTSGEFRASEDLYALGGLALTLRPRNGDGESSRPDFGRIDQLIGKWRVVPFDDDSELCAVGKGDALG
jgi:hypothetical protein